MARCALIFLFFIIIFGQLPLLLDAPASIHLLMRYAGTSLDFHSKCLQFFNFVATCFVKPQAGIDMALHTYISYQMRPVTTLNYLGVVLFILALAAFVLNHKRPIARICLGWVLFSFFILTVIGWGTFENGLILYSLYFAWAYMVLIFLLIEKTLPRWRNLRYAIYAFAISTLCYLNFPGIGELIQFGIEYYPLR